MKPVVCWLAAGLLCMAISCSVPVYDRAEINPGPSFLLGAGVGTGIAPSGYPIVWDPPLGMPYLDYYLDGIVTARLGYGINRQVGLVLEGSLGYGTWLFGPPNAPYESLALNPLIYDINLGLKIRTGRRGALMPSIGTGIFDLNFLYDFNRFYSGNFGLGLRGIGAGLTGTVYLNRNWRLQIGGRVNLPWGFWSEPGVSIGGGLQYQPQTGRVNR
ncbi:MAG: hypothetical protein ABIK38_00300 [candidate division WOR-3 bacterium]